MGNAMNQPVDKFNHAIDALRYVCMDRKLAERRVVRVRRVLFNYELGMKNRSEAEFGGANYESRRLEFNGLEALV